MKKIIYMNAKDIKKSIDKISSEILQKNNKLNDLAIIGIKTRGEILAQRIKKILTDITKIEFDYGIVDISLYRDDFDKIGHLNIGPTDLMFDVSTKQIILVDDVLYTGRTVRAALDQIIDFGRPLKIELAVLIDRNGRELPIYSNYTGKKICHSQTNKHIHVHFKESDGQDEVLLFEKEDL